MATELQAPARPDVPTLIDRFGRVATDLRVSLTDKCNLRCTYCMPAEGLAWLPHESLLTDDEIGRLIAIAVERLGVNEIRFTGGEPLLRPGLVGIIAAAASLAPRPTLSVTTNAVGLTRLAGPLAEAGLDRVAALTRRNRLDDVIAGARAADEAGLRPVKLNAVLMRGINEDEAVDLLGFALANGYQMRFIEQMPLDAQHAWKREEMVSGEEILDQLRSVFPLSPDPAVRGAAPAETGPVAGRTDAA